MKGRAILPAYTDSGALDISCPHCGAQAGTPCTKADGRISRVPCVDRLAAADLRPTADERRVINTPLGEGADIDFSMTAVDFSEPRNAQKVHQ